MTAIRPYTDEPDIGDVVGGARASRLDVNEVGTRPGATDDEAVTGPMPVVDLADGHLHVSIERGVTVLHVDGGLDDSLASLLVPAIEAAVADVRAVALVLDQVTLLDRTALADVCAAIEREDGISRCIVAGRLSGRLVLDRWNIPHTIAVFGSVADALQARAFADSGYGGGWDAGSAD